MRAVTWGFEMPPVLLTGSEPVRDVRSPRGCARNDEGYRSWNVVTTSELLFLRFDKDGLYPIVSVVIVRRKTCAASLSMRSGLGF